MDKTQRYLLLALPLVFLFFVTNFPAGLMIYWVTTNLWTTGQGLVTRRLRPKPVQPEKRSSRTPPKEDSGNGGKPSEPTPKPSPAEAQAPRRVKRKKKRARSDERRAAPGRGDGRDRRRGEVGGAARAREASARASTSPRCSSRCVSEGERGLLGVGYSPARVIAVVDPSEVAGAVDESEAAASARELVERITVGIGLTAAGSTCARTTRRSTSRAAATSSGC